MTGALMTGCSIIKRFQLVPATTVTFNTAEMQLVQLVWSLTTTSSLMETSAVQTHASEEHAQISFQIIDETVPQAMVEDNAN